MNDTSTLLELKDISITFNGSEVIHSLNLSVKRGEFVVIHGNTGCGKTAILHMIAGLVSPNSGEIIVAGDRIDQFGDAQRRWLRRSMGLMLQEELLLEDRTIVENVMLPAIAANEPISEASRRALLALNKCGISDLAELKPDMLSAGQRQLACLARAVVNRPVLILADEPIAHLDENNQRILTNLLKAFSKAGVTIILASHHHLNVGGCPFREITISHSRKEC